ncbi:MFS transporter [Kitasatospora sp. NPDC057692]|uniref:MFS transporter n=1 Tax=Kitasatospora sp. NPDC057692 TaxID=3346215 RepID=UPI00368608CA
MSTSSTSPATTSGTPSTASVGEAKRGGTIALLVILACQLMVIVDATIVNVALPSLQKSLHFSNTNLAWVINAYTLAFGGLLLLGGRAGDILGRRRVFIAGIAVFTAASLGAGLANNETVLIIARAVQGVGAAIAAPSTLALIVTNFQDAARTKAISIYSTVSGAGAAIGLILGGVLTDWVSWRWVFFVNIPVGLAIIVLAPRYIKEPPRNAGRFDLPGAVTATGGLVSLVYAFIRVSSNGWSDGTALACFAAAVVLLTAFILIELRTEQSLLPLKLLNVRNRTAGYGNMLLLSAAMFGMFYFLTLFLQDVLDFSPLQTGFAFLPLALGLFSTARFVPKLLPKFGPKPLMLTGNLMITAGIVWSFQIDEGSTYLAGLFGPLLLFGIGAGLSFVPLNVTILAGVPPQDSGAAAGLLQSMQQIGGALGIAILITVFGDATRQAAKDAGAEVVAKADHILSEGISSALAIGTVFSAAAALVTLLVIRTPKPAAAPLASVKS